MLSRISLIVLVLIATSGCQTAAKRDVSFSGLATPNILHSLEPSLVPEMESTWFIALKEYNPPQNLRVAEQYALASLVTIPSGPMFRPDAKGKKQVAAQLVHLSRNLRGTLKTWFKRSEAYLPMVRREFAKANMPEPLIYLPFIESGYSPRALSHAGARGIWQFMPATGNRFGLQRCSKNDDRCNPEKSTRAAIAYLRILYGMFDDWSLALAAYNCGEGKISGAIRRTGAKNFFELAQKNHTLPRKYRLARETLAYVPRFIAMVQIVNNMERLGFKAPKWKKAKQVAAAGS